MIIQGTCLLFLCGWRLFICSNCPCVTYYTCGMEVKIQLKQWNDLLVQSQCMVSNLHFYCSFAPSR
jgi:hypothetical protein